jgi:hypothetical protein
MTTPSRDEWFEFHRRGAKLICHDVQVAVCSRAGYAKGKRQGHMNAVLTQVERGGNKLPRKLKRRYSLMCNALQFQV